MKFRKPIFSQQDFENDFRGLPMATLKLDEILDMVQYEICGPYFSVTNCETIRGKNKESILKINIDNGNGYVKRSIKLGENVCIPAAYAKIWNAFKQAKEILFEENVEEETQEIVVLEGKKALVASAEEA